MSGLIHGLGAMGKALRWILIGSLLVSANSIASTAEFERPAELEPDIEFWRRVYTEITTREGFVHDNRNLAVVYEVVQFREGASRRQRQKQVERAKSHYRAILAKLASGKRSGLTKHEQRVLALWPEDVSNATLKAARSRIRFQLGQANKFREGLVRSGIWEPYIRQTFSEMGVPVEIAALPHVESSYNPAARSHVGASGLWQFTRSTGRRFMRIDHVVDERRDPHTSTVAAGRLMLHNYSVIGSWPLAITAYNHGAAGMRRAKRMLDTDDIATINRNYKGRTFGFASRNFYVAFLAALDVSSNAEKYFGPLRRDPPDDSITVTVPEFVAIDSLERAFDVERSVLMASNPALMPSVWNGSKRVPRNFELRLPRSAFAGDAMLAMAEIPDSERFRVQTPDTFHTVQRGDTLSKIASYYRVSQADLVALNNLRSRHRIRVGQVLRLPVTSSGAAVTVAAEQRPTEDVYIVRRGDSVSVIAKRFGLDEGELLAINQINNKNRIYAGQQLRLVQASASSTPETPPPTEEPTPVEEPASEIVVAVAEPTPVEEPPAEIGVTAVEPAVVAATEEITIEPEPVVDAEAVPPPVDGIALAQPPEVEAVEPVADTLDTISPVSEQAAQTVLSADPSDYTASEDSTIEIQAAETLGHYAEWLDLRASHLRRINGMTYGTPVVIGRRLKLDFARVDPETFERRRLDYHKALQEQFFTRFRITGTQQHTVRSGDVLWVLSQRTYHVPVWLLRQYNPDLDIAFVRPGNEVTFPMLAEVSAAD